MKKDRKKTLEHLKGVVIAVDFDGTVVSHEFPKIGRDIGAGPVLRELNRVGAKLILNTMRGEGDLERALFWFVENGVELWHHRTNPTQKTWTDSPKTYAQIYVDDAAIGVPLKQDAKWERPYVDWIRVRAMLCDWRQYGM